MTFIDAKEVRELVDKLVGSAYLDGVHELGAASDETRSVRSALEQVLSQQAETLAKYQPCGCVICTCEDEKQCQGCGAKHCGNRTDHPAYVKRQPEAWITPGGDVSRSFHWCLERCLPGQLPRPLYAAQQQGQTTPPSTPVRVKTLYEFMAEQEELRPGIHSKVQAVADELRASLAQQPAAVDEEYPTPRNRAEAVALARLARAYLGVIEAHIDAAVARCETDLGTKQQEPTTCKHDFRRDEDHGGACCQLCGEVRQ